MLFRSGAQQAIDKLGASFDNLKMAVSGIDQQVGGLNTKIGSLSFSQSFLSSMDKLASLLNALGNGIEAAGRLMSGDGKGLGESLSRMGSDLQDYMKQSLFDVANSVIAGKAETIIANRTPAEQQAASIREAVAERQAAPSIVFEAGSLTVEVGGIITPDDLLLSLRSPMEKIAQDAFGGAISNAMVGLKETK